MKTPWALVAPGCPREASQSLVCSPWLLGGCWRTELGSWVCMLTPLVRSDPPLTFQSNLVGGGSIAARQGRAGESRSRHDRACACAQMESHNLIPFNRLLVNFSSTLELWLGSPRVLASHIVNAANSTFLLCLAVSLGPISAPDHGHAHFSPLFLGCRGDIGICNCWP